MPVSARADAVARRAHPLAMARFGLRGLWPASALARLFATPEPAKALIAGLGRALDAAAERARDTAPSHCCSACSPTPSAGRSSRAAARAWSMRCRRDRSGAAESFTPAAGSATSARSASSRSRCWTSRPASCWRSPGSGCRRAIAGALGRFRYGPGVCKVDWALQRPRALAGGGLPGTPDTALRRHASRRSR